MPKLYSMNILILCIFLLHFVASKEQLFLKLKGDSQAKVEQDSNKKLKANKASELTFGEDTTHFYSKRSLEEKSKKPKIAKTTDWKTVNINKNIKALKRYRIVDRKNILKKK